MPGELILVENGMLNIAQFPSMDPCAAFLLVLTQSGGCVPITVKWAWYGVAG